MARKKTNGFNKQLRVFVISLLIVLVTGGIAMAFCLIVGSGETGNVESQIIDFSWFSGQSGSSSQSDDGNTGGMSGASGTTNIPDEISAANEQLYQTSLANGENVRLVD